MNLLRKLFGQENTSVMDWRAVRSMLTAAEREHLFHAARDRFTGQGAILDLGTWLGGSTAALAAGLKENRNERTKSQKVHAFDLFELNSYLKQAYPYPELADVPAGGSFLHVFQRNLTPWAIQVETHPGDFTKYDHPLGPVELVHVDIMKNWALTNAVLRKFFRDLIPGVSMVLHQDFVHYNTVWIHLVMYRLRDHFEAVSHVPGSTTVEFKLRSAIPSSLLDHEYGFADFDAPERQAAFAWSRSPRIGASALLEHHRRQDRLAMAQIALVHFTVTDAMIQHFIALAGGDDQQFTSFAQPVVAAIAGGDHIHVAHARFLEPGRSLAADEHAQSTAFGHGKVQHIIEEESDFLRTQLMRREEGVEGVGFVGVAHVTAVHPLALREALCVLIVLPGNDARHREPLTVL